MDKALRIKRGLTQRAADGWDSARFLGFFVALAGFRFQACFSPAAANASR